MNVGEMTRDEFAEAVKKDPVGIFVIGAVEAHGPHLPLNADTVQPEWVAEELARRIENVLVFPSINYGLHSSTKNMPGTVSITFDTMRSLLYDVLVSAHEKGIHKFLVMTGHAGSGHMTACSEACKRFVRETGCKVMFLTDYDIAADSPDMEGIRGDGHGGMLETARVLAIRPDLVKEIRPIGLYSDQGYMIVSNAEVCFPDGFAGDTTEASEEIGKRINAFVADRLEEMILNGLV
ncbi:MAG: creatininase family protein [Candidatus Methanomethylophilaceae archaeon]|jgi:creatinine amidohydrolase